MHSTRLSNRGELSKTKALKLETTIKTASILAIIIDIEVANSKTSFLAFRAINT